MIRKSFWSADNIDTLEGSMTSEAVGGNDSLSRKFNRSAEESKKEDKN